MESVNYCTPEWLDECYQRYYQNPRFEQDLEKISVRVAFRIQAEPEWGIQNDIIFGGVIEKGKLLKLGFLSEDAAKNEAEFIMAATPQEWKKILRKENKFLTDFMLGKITLQQGSKVGVLAVAPHANTLVDFLTQVPLVFPDELSPKELERYCAHVHEFRLRMGV
jgi:hypothetical protein